jgi:hypothetical protein
MNGVGHLEATKVTQSDTLHEHPSERLAALPLFRDASPNWLPRLRNERSRSVFRRQSSSRGSHAVVRGLEDTCASAVSLDGNVVHTEGVGGTMGKSCLRASPAPASPRTDAMPLFDRPSKAIAECFLINRGLALAFAIGRATRRSARVDDR